MATYLRQTTILGGLPVIAEVWFGVDDHTGEGLSEVEAIYWCKRNGKRGRQIPQAIFDRAEKYDPYFAALTEHVLDILSSERDEHTRDDHL